MKSHAAREGRLDRRAALMPYLYSLRNADPKKAKPKFSDFILHKPPKRKKRQTADEQLAAMKMANTLLGGKVE